MKTLIKKGFLVLFIAVFIATLSLSVFSAEVKVTENFYVYGEHTDKVCEVLGVEENALESYCKQNNVTFLAVDKDNKRQIKAFCYETDFSNSIINISSMNDDNISQLAPQIVGIDNVTADVLTKGSQKFIKTTVMTEDSGGEYVLTSFATVANKMNYSLNFYTLKGEDTDYIDAVFDDFAKSQEFAGEKSETFSVYRILIFIGVVIFITAFVLVGLSVIKDLRNKNSKSDQVLEENENIKEPQPQQTQQETENNQENSQD